VVSVDVVAVPLPTNALFVPVGGSQAATEVGQAYVLGPENRLLEHWFTRFFDDKAQQPPSWITGPGGYGKTALAHGICAYFQRYFPDQRALHVSVGDIQRAHDAATQTRGFVDWESRLSEVSLAVLDNLDDAAGDCDVQATLIRIFDTLAQNGSRLILCSRQGPRRLSGWLPGLESRLRSAFHIPIQSLSPITASEFLRELAVSHGVKLSNATIQLLAGRAGSLANRLQSELNLWCQAATSSPDLSESLLRKSYLHKSSSAHSKSLVEIARAVSRALGVSHADLRGPTRRKAVVQARGIVAKLAKVNSAMTLREIGGFLGGRDHTTVLHAIRQLEMELLVNSSLAGVIQDIQTSLTATDRSDGCSLAVGKPGGDDNIESLQAEQPVRGRQSTGRNRRSPDGLSTLRRRRRPHRTSDGNRLISGG
jgi:chromosomal replication initiator protein